MFIKNYSLITKGDKSLSHTNFSLSFYFILPRSVVKSSHGGSVIDVSEQFIMKRQVVNENSRYNPNIIMMNSDSGRRSVASIHELRTNFNNNDTF